MDLATLMFIGYRAMNDRVVGEMRDAGYQVTLAQARIAQRIPPEGVRLTELAGQAQVSKQTASLLVDSLEEQGWLERVPDPEDGRARLIRFTERGLAAARHAGTIVQRVEQTWIEHLGPELATSLREGLEKLREVADPYR